MKRERFAGWLTDCFHVPAYVYLRDLSGETDIHAVTLRKKVQIKRISLSGGILTPGQSVLELIMKRHAPDSVATEYQSNSLGTFRRSPFA